MTDLEVLKTCIKDYNILKKDIKDRIDKGYDIENLYDYIRHLSACDITNIELGGNDSKYLDFNYSVMCLSIYQDSKDTKPYLGDAIEVWNDEEMEYIGTFSNIDEIEETIKKKGNDWYGTKNDCTRCYFYIQAGD